MLHSTESCRDRNAHCQTPPACDHTNWSGGCDSRSLSFGWRPRISDGDVHGDDEPRDWRTGSDDPQRAACSIGQGRRSPLMKVLVIATLLGIVASLGRAMFSMVSGPQDNKQMVNALTLRIGLSVALF